MSDNDLYYDTHMDDGTSEREPSRAGRIVSIVLKTAGAVLIAAILFILIYRMVEMREPSGTGALIFTEKTAQAYKEAADAKVSEQYADAGRYAYEKETLREVTLTEKGKTKEDYRTVVLPSGEYYETVGRQIYEANTGAYTDTVNGTVETVKVTGYYEVKNSPVEGAMRANHVYLLPFADQVQLTFRYKSDALSKLGGKTDGLGNEFTYRLFDDAGGVYDRYLFKTAERGVYRYITMVFDGVDLKTPGKLTLAVRYVGGDGKTEELDIVVYDEKVPLPLLVHDYGEPEPTELCSFEPDR